MYSLLDKIVDRAIRILSHYKDKREEQRYIDGIRNCYEKLANKKELTKEQSKEIQDYFSNLFGKKITLDYHKYFYSRTGIFSKKYIGTSSKSNSAFAFTVRSFIF